MTLGDLKKAMYAYVGRDPNGDTTAGVLVQHGVDLVLLAINQARLKAQREHDFNALVTVGGAEISMYGKSYDEFVTYPTSEATQVFRTVLGVYEYTLSATNQIRLGKAYDKQDVSELDRVAGRNISGDALDTDRQFVYSFGRKLFLFDAEDTWVAVRGTPILADLTNSDLDDGSDFFLAHGHDWLLFQGVRQLNFLLKEDQRVNVSAAAVDDAWTSLKKIDQDFNSNWTDLD